MWWPSWACNTFGNLLRIVTLWSSIFGVSRDLNQNLSLSLFILSQAVSSYLRVHLLSSLSFQLSCPKISRSFSPSPRLLFIFFLFLSPHLCSAPSPRSVFPLFFPPLSPGNQTSGEECWVSTFPEKRTIWATQRPTMDPLCSLLPVLCHRTAAHTYTQTQKHALNYIKTHIPSACYSCLPPVSVPFTFLCVKLFFIFSQTRSFHVLLLLQFCLHIYCGALTHTFSCTQLKSVLLTLPLDRYALKKSGFSLLQCKFN